MDSCQALDPSAQLDLIERLLVALRAATEGGLMPGADGRKRSMSDSQLRLVAAVQPEVRSVGRHAWGFVVVACIHVCGLLLSLTAATHHPLLRFAGDAHAGPAGEGAAAGAAGGFGRGRRQGPPGTYV